MGSDGILDFWGGWSGYDVVLFDCDVWGWWNYCDVCVGYGWKCFGWLCDVSCG